jgi:hypothetical protein
VTRFRGTPSLSIDQNHGKATWFRGETRLWLTKNRRRFFC